MKKTITYDHGDYRMELDDQYIGHASTYSQAETTLNQTAYEWLTHGDCATATELDGGAFTPPDIPDETEPSEGGPNPDGDRPRAICADPTCQGPHHIQHCPSIRALLLAEPVVVVMDVDHTPVGWAA